MIFVVDDSSVWKCLGRDNLVNDIYASQDMQQFDMLVSRPFHPKLL